MKQKEIWLKKYNNALAPIYNLATKQIGWFAPMYAKSLLRKVVKSGMKVLDVGTGTGQSLEFCLRRGCQIVGLDISERMLEIARKRYPTVKFYKVNIEQKLPKIVLTQKFDIIQAIGMVEFVSNPRKVFAVFSKLLKKGGYLCFTYEEYLPLSNMQKWKISPLFRGTRRPSLVQSFFVYRYTYSDVRTMLDIEHFKIIRHKRFIAYTKTQDEIPVYYTIVLARRY